MNRRRFPFLVLAALALFALLYLVGCSSQVPAPPPPASAPAPPPSAGELFSDLKVVNDELVHT